MGRTRILVVDDEQGMLEVCAASLKKVPGTTVLVEQDSRRAAGRLARESFDLLIADICMPHVNGVDLLRVAKEADPNIGVLMITAFPTVETAVETMKLGAADYITKPFRPEELRAVVTRLLETRQLRDENRLLQRQVDKTYAFDDMIGHCPAMQAVFDTIQRVAETDVDVLILGE
ncbi:MAG: response regulator, partial [Phycisphaerales bacterium]